MTVADHRRLTITLPASSSRPRRGVVLVPRLTRATRCRCRCTTRPRGAWSSRLSRRGVAMPRDRKPRWKLLLDVVVRPGADTVASLDVTCVCAWNSRTSPAALEGCASFLVELPFLQMEQRRGDFFFPFLLPQKAANGGRRGARVLVGLYFLTGSRCLSKGHLFQVLDELTGG